VSHNASRKIRGNVFYYEISNPTLYGSLDELMFGMAMHVMRCDQILGTHESLSPNGFE